MAPVVIRLRGFGDALSVRVVTTGQHRALLDRALADFAIVPDVDLDLMRVDQNLADSTARALSALAAVFAGERPDLVLAQGDTTTVLASALASYYAQIPFGHVEAGLRTGRPYSPFPEEKNRALAGQLASLHFAPTRSARANLLREGIDPATIRVVGNTVIDALLMTAGRDDPLSVAPPTPRFALVTAHRRENFGPPLVEICSALRAIVARDPGLSVVFPVHPNPSVRGVVEAELGNIERIRRIEPVGYREFVALMKASSFILTDSGGVQEEAPSLGKPVLLLRDETERPEAVAAGVVRLVGPHRSAIVAAVAEVSARLAGSSAPCNPYGDGLAAERIARAIAARFGLDPGPAPLGFAPEWSGGDPTPGSPDDRLGP